MPKLFGTSGIRGIANKDLTAELALKVALALATKAGKGKFLVGRDTRVSGECLENAIISGILSAGARVRKLGIVPTPVLAFLTKKHDLDFGIMITASHNPPQFNGIKIFNRNGVALNTERQEDIERIIESENFKLAKWNEIGECQDASHWIDDYIKLITENLSLERSWRVVIDAGCGATFSLAPLIFRELGCRVKAINAQPDGFFPARSPLPDEESLKPLCNIVRRLKADIGLAYDGDGDRMVAVDEEGNLAPLDQTLALYAAYAIKKAGSGTIVTHVEASMCIEKVVEEAGGKVVRTKVGDVSIASAMKEHNAVFGGEPCGAWIHPEYHYCPDGILSSVLLLKMLEEKGKGLSQLLKQIPHYPILREKIECPNLLKEKVMQKVEHKIESVFPDFKEKLTVDGVRLSLSEGWILIRPSGTEPLIRVTVEAERADLADEIMRKALQLVNRVIREAKA